MIKRLLIKAALLLFIMCCCVTAYTQIPDCNLIYLKQRDGIDSYNPLLPVSATNPVKNIIKTGFDNFFGLAISPILHSGSSVLTFYTVDSKLRTYTYYDPLTGDWVNTGHSTGSATAVNLAAGNRYIFGLVGGIGDVYRYDGLGPAKRIINTPDLLGCLYDVVADCEDNCYILNMRTDRPFLRKYNAEGVLLRSWVIHNASGKDIDAGAGFAIMGTTLYTDNRNTATGGGITVYSMGEDTLEVIGTTSDVELSVGDDMASCAGSIAIHPTISIKATKTSLCEGSEPVTFTATPLAGGPKPVYQWLVNDVAAVETGANFTYLPANGDKIVCVMTSSSPCASPPVVSSDTISMVVYEAAPRPPAVVSPVVYCKGATPAPLQVTKSVASSKLYWYTAASGGDPDLSAPVPSTDTPRTFTYYVSEGDGDCESTRVPLTVLVEEMMISGLPPGHPTVYQGRDGFIRFKTNKAYEVYKVTYCKNNAFKSELMLTADASGDIIIPDLEEGIYTAITISNAYGCVRVMEPVTLAFCDHNKVPMPNSFTPNGDHINDVFYVRGSGFTVKRFYIYDRLGNLVFSKENFPPNDPQYGWDGKTNGKVISDAAGFVYMLETVCLGTNTPLLTKGAVLMIK